MKIIYSEKIGKRKGLDVCLQHIENEFCSFRVDYAGNGHYFKSFDEAINYIIHRRFVAKKDIFRLYGA